MIRSLIQRFLLYPLMQLVAPPYCASCRQWLAGYTVFCDQCAARIKPIASYTLEITRTKKTKVIAISTYDDPIKSLVLGKRSANIIASVQLGQLVCQWTMVTKFDVDYLIPVPLHWTRYAWRGYNQADEMARVIAHNLVKPILQVQRKYRTLPQAVFNRDGRLENVANVFTVSSGVAEQIRGKRVLIVDDVMTTGATIMTLSRVLYRCGAAQVTAVVACRVT